MRQKLTNLILKNMLLIIALTCNNITVYSQEKESSLIEKHFNRFSKSDYQTYLSKAEKKQVMYISETQNLSEMNKIISDCGAYYDFDNRTLINKGLCSSTWWMGNLPLENNGPLGTYEFELKFSLNIDAQKTEKLKTKKVFPLQIMLGNSPTGYAFLGVDSNGKFYISYNDKNGFKDLITVFKADRVSFNKPNHLKFVWFPNGAFYVELNSYKRWSIDYPKEKNMIIPQTGISNRITFYSDLTIHHLELNALQVTEDYSLNYDNNQLKVIGTLVNGIHDGEWKVYHKNGQLIKINHYKNGKQIGESKHYYPENGQLESIATYENGFKIGELKLYHKNGQLKEIGNYSDLYVPIGEYKTYYDNGQLEETGIYTEGNAIGEWKTYYKSGIIKSVGLYKEGEKNGLWKLYHENGQLKEVGNYNKDKIHGEYKVYYDDGQLFRLCYLNNGALNGQDTGYYQNGNLWMQGNHLAGKPNGEWNIYHSNGKIHQTRLWKEGKFMDVISCFDGHGNRADKGSLINGNGTVNEYDIEGNLTKQTTYVKGIEQKE